MTIGVGQPMGWKNRKGKRYFYRSERVGGRVISHYIGNGETAQLISQIIESRRDQKEIEQEYEKLVYGRMDAEDAEADAIFDVVELVTTAALLATGHHKHDRTWRRKRNAQSETSLEKTGDAEDLGSSKGAD